MTIEYKSNVDLKKTADNIKTKLEHELGRQMEIAKSEIIRRTLGGKDVDSNRFIKYSDSYLEFLKRKRKATNVDLSYKNDMLRSLQTSVATRQGEIEGKIYTNPEEQKKIRYAHEGASNRPVRKFFALSKQQLNKITKALSKLGKL